jgi:hypothetical protein
MLRDLFISAGEQKHYNNMSDSIDSITQCMKCGRSIHFDDRLGIPVYCDNCFFELGDIAEATMTKFPEDKDKGKRFNTGKSRHDLLPAFAVEQMARVFTKGAEKYAERNWERGMKWSKALASLKRHVNAFERGEDFDKETGLLHMAHAMTNAAFLVEYYRIYPQGDDRPIYTEKPLRIGLDIDGVLSDFIGGIRAEYPFGMDDPESWNTPRIRDMFEIIKNNESFWLGLKPLVDPKKIPFEPACYITFRATPASITQQWLDNYEFPRAPLISLEIHGSSKVEAAKDQNLDVFVDDRYETFLELNAAGIFCYLMDAPHNRKYNVGFRRIFDLREILFPRWTATETH